MNKYILSITLTLILSQIIHAQDRIFTYTYQSTVLNPGQKEMEIWTTLSNQTEHYYVNLEDRFEFEVGIAKNIQTAFYLINSWSKEIKLQDSTQTLVTGSSFSIANEWKWKLSDPVLNPVGSALYFEYKLAPSEFELEGKIILDKQTGNFLQAFNLVGELEFEKEFEKSGNEIEVSTEKEYVLEFLYSISYQVNTHWWLGLEALEKTKFEHGEAEYSVLQAGPAFSFNTKGFWLNLTFLPQIRDFKHSGLNHEDLPLFNTRLIFSYVF